MADWIEVQGWLSRAECSVLMSEGDGDFEPGRVYETSGSIGVVSGRDVDVRWIAAEGHWLWPRWVDLVEGSAGMLGVDIDLTPAGWSWQLARYSAGQVYEEHQDIRVTRRGQYRERKVSVCVLLAGPGQFRFATGIWPGMRAGDAIVFPSVVPHAVVPCDEERWSLVGWVEGPRWR